ncbi:MAG: DNA repair protein RadA [Bacillota bacterium]|jgi:DNA repair protein RadA/Sms|nr:DNA repair protein RadA [Bacillota bacterium]
MKGPKQVFACRECGYESPKWMGRCPGCSQWNTFEETTRFDPGLARPARPSRAASRSAGTAAAASAGAGREDSGRPVPVGQVASLHEPRLMTGLSEFDRVLGGGIVPGSVILIGGDPGIGKSTLLLQVSENVARAHGAVLYVTGEESARQVGIRAARLGVSSEKLLVMAETDVVKVIDEAARLSPALVVIDSIQTMDDPSVESSPGSVTQVRECAAALMRLAKEQAIPVFLVGHVTKAGAIAGPKVLEHVVDTVLYFEGEGVHAHRVVRAAKNRFGSTDEVGIFAMTDRGLEEVANPSETLLSQRLGEAAGSVVTASVEGARPLLVEVQALVARSVTGTPRRTITGVDYNRTSIIVAVLDRRAGFNLGGEDVYVNVAGGLTLAEPASDLAVACAIVSSFRNRPVPKGTVVFGEVGLAGELRAVSRAELRLAEAERLGFTRCVMPRHNLRALSRRQGQAGGASGASSSSGSSVGSASLGTWGNVELVGASTVREAINAAFQEA